MARVRLPPKVQSTDREINALQSAIGDTLREVSYHDQLTGQSIQSLSVTTAGVVVSHSLGRTPIGWSLTDLLDHGTVKRTAWDSKTITLASSSGTIRCDVFVW